MKFNFAYSLILVLCFICLADAKTGAGGNSPPPPPSKPVVAPTVAKKDIDTGIPPFLSLENNPKVYMGFKFNDIQLKELGTRFKNSNLKIREKTHIFKPILVFIAPLFLMCIVLGIVTSCDRC